MKKILVLMAMLALALGAQAAEGETPVTPTYTYTFNIGINGLPPGYQFTEFTGLYLIDKTHHSEGAAGTVLAYTLSSEYHFVDGQWSQMFPATHDATTLELNGVKYDNVVSTVKSGNLGTSQSLAGSLTFTGAVEGDGAIPFDNPYYPTGKGVTMSDLQLVVWDSQTSFYQMLENTPLSPMSITIGISSDVHGNTNWAVTSTLYVNVPEPTSGLLMLLGVAGLALRRKRIA